MSASHGPIVRTYRGRSLEELIPRIREELGPDAIILREREGLTGGINGFFAQRCVEVDAQAPAGVDFYDEDDEAMPEPAEPEYSSAPGYFAEPAYAAELEHAEEPAYAAGPEHLEEPAYAAGPEHLEEPAYDAEPAYAAEVAVAEAPVVDDEPVDADVPEEELTFSQRLDRARRERQAMGGTFDAPPSATATLDREPPTAPPPAADAETRPPTPTPYPTGVRPGKLKVRPKPSRTFPGAGVPQALAAEPEPITPPLAHGAARLDAAAAGTVARELIGRGISEAWAHELIVAAAAHLTPFAEGDGLREAVRAGIAAGITSAPLLPSSGAAVAFIGAGGAGKTRCAAAMAARYARASTLRVSVVSLTPGPRRGDVATLLDGRGIEIQALSGDALAETVARGRERGLVVLDTPSTSPGDPQGVADLAAALDAAELDAIYLTVPATLSATAARNLLDGLGPAGPTALVITHADETQDLGIATELAYQTGVPIAFVHGGLDVDRALSIADPARVAEQVLP